MSGPFDFESGELRIVSTVEAETTHLVWNGTSDARDPATELVPFFTRVAEGLARKRAVVDLRSLEYMNSATVSTLIVFARLLDTHEVTTRVLFDTNVGWQRVNLVAMRSIARTLSHLSVEG